MCRAQQFKWCWYVTIIQAEATNPWVIDAIHQSILTFELPRTCNVVEYSIFSPEFNEGVMLQNELLYNVLELKHFNSFKPIQIGSQFVLRIKNSILRRIPYGTIWVQSLQQGIGWTGIQNKSHCKRIFPSLSRNIQFDFFACNYLNLPKQYGARKVSSEYWVISLM